MDVERKFEPFTVKEKDCPPDITAVGDNELILGMAFAGFTGLLIGWLWPAAHPLKRTARSKLDTKAAFVFILYLAARLAGGSSRC
jgi:hypothetical protein